MMKLLDFFFILCSYFFPSLLVLVFIARMSRGHALRLLLILKSKLENKFVLISLFAVFSILFAAITFYARISGTFLDLAVGALAGVFFAGIACIIVRILPEYLRGEEE